MALPFAATAILLASVTLNAVNPQRSKANKAPGAGTGTGGFSSRHGGGTKNRNRATQLSSPDFGGSLSGTRRAPPARSSHGQGSSRHTRTQSMNRNVPHTPASATISMNEIHSRNASSGSKGGSQRTGGASRDARRGVLSESTFDIFDIGRLANSWVFPNVVQQQPRHNPSRSLPANSYSATNRNPDARRPAFSNTSEFLGNQEPRENKDQRRAFTFM